MTRTLLKILTWATFIELAVVTSAAAADLHASRRAHAKASAAQPAVYSVLPPYRSGFTGGWYAQNYHYFYGRAPLVSYDDPYDYHGDYFPPPQR